MNGKFNNGGNKGSFDGGNRRFDRKPNRTGGGFGGGRGGNFNSNNSNVDRFNIGDVFKGAKVKTIIPVGVFIELDAQKDGFLHISEVSNKRIENIDEYVKVGDLFDVEITDINAAMGRIRLKNLNKS
jgi:hypothetical protein